MTRNVLLVLLGALLVAGVLVFREAVIDSIVVTDPRVRAMPPGSSSTAAYLTLKNTSSSDIKLERVSTPVSDNVKLHDTVKKDGKVKMQHLAEVVIPAGKKVKFKPGRMHIMIMNLKKRLTIGETVPLTLYFSDGEEITVKAAVQKQVFGQGNLSG